MYSIFVFAHFDFEKTPTIDEIKELMLNTVDVMDNENFCSLACAVMGYATYDELKNAMISNAQMTGDKVNISMTDGYRVLKDKSDGISSPRYDGRMHMLAIHIIKNKISPERAQQLIDEQTPLLMIMQEAYNVADDIECDILRKLRYLALCKRMDSDNYSDIVVGRLEAISMIEEDKYSLRY